MILNMILNMILDMMYAVSFAHTNCAFGRNFTYPWDIRLNAEIKKDAEEDHSMRGHLGNPALSDERGKGSCKISIMRLVKEKNRLWCCPTAGIRPPLRVQER